MPRPNGFVVEDYFSDSDWGELMVCEEKLTIPFRSLEWGAVLGAVSEYALG